MPAVTQLTPNFLGGVSKQNDDKKLQGQLTDCVNGYPDPTFGLLKRPGMQHTNVLRKTDNSIFTKAELSGAAWFFVDRASAGSYIGCIKGTQIHVWNAETGTACTVTAPGGGAIATGYLTGTVQNNYHFRSIQDTTIITNKTVDTGMLAAGSFLANSVGVLRLIAVTSGDSYTTTLQGLSATATAVSTSTFDTMLAGTNASETILGSISNLITTQQAASNSDFSGRWYLEAYLNSLVIRRTDEANGVVTNYSTPGGTALAFTLNAKGGDNNKSLEVYLDDVTSIDKLALESFHGNTVRVLNSASADDDYYLKYVAHNGVRGEGYWEETLARNISPGLDPAKMPHELINKTATTFTYGPIDWEGRLTGDDKTNAPPSFITVNDTTPVTYTGKKLSSTFFYSNRFGVLSEDNVFLGVANDSYNFFAKSALVQIDSDPLDLNVSSVRPVTLSDVLPSPQGLLLFSERQQFQLYATDASVLTPSSAVIRSLSNYEMATDIAPIDVGTTPAFVSRVPGYSKLFTLALRDVEQSPIVVDISKAVLEWIPDSVDGMTTSPPNSLIMLVDRDTSNLYLYRYYNNGKEDLFQAWTRWQLPNTIQAAKIINDSVYVVGQHEDQYTIGKIELDEMPTGTVISEPSSITGNSCLDFAVRPVSPGGGVAAVVYDSTNDITKIYVPYIPIADKEAAMLLTVPRLDVGTDSVIDSDQGYWAKATERTEIGTGHRYFEVMGDFSSYADGIVVGYNYDFEATLPKFYFRRNETTTDYTATLTVARANFSIGKTGAITFKIKSNGANDWSDIQHTAEADYYSGDTNPVVSERVFTVPVHRRNTNFELKVTSNFPYPVSLVSMMWEGNYSPRLYRRT